MKNAKYKNQFEAIYVTEQKNNFDIIHSSLHKWINVKWKKVNSREGAPHTKSYHIIYKSDISISKNTNYDIIVLEYVAQYV